MAELFLIEKEKYDKIERDEREAQQKLDKAKANVTQQAQLADKKTKEKARKKAEAKKRAARKKAAAKKKKEAQAKKVREEKSLQEKQTAVKKAETEKSAEESNNEKTGFDHLNAILGS
jgi:hypothetical protein